MTEYHRTDPKDWPKPKPKAKEVMGDMNDDMRRFLRAAMVSGVDPDHIGTDPEKHTFHSNTLRALRKHGLVHLVSTKKKRELWRPTDDGRGLAMRHEPLFLRAKPGSVRYKTLPPAEGKSHGRHAVDDSATGDGDYTGERRLAMKHEPEVLDRAA